MAERVARAAIDAFMAPISTASRGGGAPRSSFGPCGVPIDQVYWLGAQVRGAKIVFFGFFRTESDALEAVT